MNCGHASVHQPGRIASDAEGAHQRPLDCVGEAADTATRPPVAGASEVSSFNDGVHVGFLFLDDLIALYAMGLYLGHTLGSGLLGESSRSMGCLFGIMGLGFWTPPGDSNG